MNIVHIGTRMLGLCFSDDWTEHTHEDLLLMCKRYALTERPLT